jgi:hypothetical protein
MSTGTLRSFARNFAGSPAPEATATAEARVPADVWMNVGYEQPGKDEEGNDIVTFIGVPLGIALDTQKPIDTSKTRSANLLKTQTKQNALLEQLQQAATELKPGEECIVNLAVQIRRVKGPLEAPADDGERFALEMVPTRTAG